MDKDTLIKIGNLLVKVLTPIVDAEREKAAEAKARAHAAEADFRRTRCQLCYEPRRELDLEVAHRVVCARCLDRCARALLERRARLRDQQRELDGLIAHFGDMFRDGDAPAPEINFGDIVAGFDEMKASEPAAGITFSDICEGVQELTNAVGSPHAPKHAAERDLTIDPRAVVSDTDPLARAKEVSGRLDVMERLIRAPGRRPARGSA